MFDQSEFFSDFSTFFNLTRPLQPHEYHQIDRRQKIKFINVNIIIYYIWTDVIWQMYAG